MSTFSLFVLIKAGEAIGTWQKQQPMQQTSLEDGPIQLPNVLELPFRRQPAAGESEIYILWIW